MSSRHRIRVAGAADLIWLRKLAARHQSTPFRTAVADGCVLVAHAEGQLAGYGVLDLDTPAVRALWVAPRWRRQGIARDLLAATERRAVCFGVTELLTRTRDVPAAFWDRCGYRAASSSGGRRRRFSRRQTRFGALVAGVLERLRIPSDYGRRHRLSLQAEARELQCIGRDVNDREQFLQPRAARAFLAMQSAARAGGIDLLVASAYRAVDYQAGIIERKLERGQDLQQILEVSAAPGYSEHHSGRAVDVATADSAPLEVDFEDTAAYAWLTRNAASHGFRLSFPRRNRHGIAFEPWHWYWTGS